jgi:hypothetical protein
MKTEPKTYSFFKVKFDENEAVIHEFTKPITLKQARILCVNTFGHNAGFCVSLSLKDVIVALKYGLKLYEVKIVKDKFVKVANTFPIKALKGYKGFDVEKYLETI